MTIDQECEAQYGTCGNAYETLCKVVRNYPKITGEVYWYKDTDITYEGPRDEYPYRKELWHHTWRPVSGEVLVADGDNVRVRKVTHKGTYEAWATGGPYAMSFNGVTQTDENAECNACILVDEVLCIALGRKVPDFSDYSHNYRFENGHPIYIE